MFDHSVFYILPLFVPLLQGYILALLCLKHSLTTSKSRNNIGHLTQKPECPACQKENSAEPIPEKPPVIEHHLWIPTITIVPTQTAHTMDGWDLVILYLTGILTVADGVS